MQNRLSVKACSGSERFDANPADLSSMPFGILLFQLSIGLPIIRQSTPSLHKCAATDNPKGPAPTMVTSHNVDKPHLPSVLACRSSKNLPHTEGQPLFGRRIKPRPASDS